MKHTSVCSDAQQRTARLFQHHPVMGSKGVSIAPPAYGIDFVDRQQLTAEEMTVQRYGGETSLPPVKQQENRTGLPDQVKAGIESLSGFDMSDVRVHYNSSKPAQLQALAYTQGTEIHVAPGQEMYLPHEAWHVVQQVQGRVQPTMQLKGGLSVNNDQGLEQEADVMGEAAAQLRQSSAPGPGRVAESEMSVYQSGETGEIIQDLEALGKVAQRQSVIQLSRRFWGASPPVPRWGEWLQDRRAL